MNRLIESHYFNVGNMIMKQTKSASQWVVALHHFGKIFLYIPMKKNA